MCSESRLLAHNRALVNEQGPGYERWKAAWAAAAAQMTAPTPYDDSST